jgi:hypothetical protein
VEVLKKEEAAKNKAEKNQRSKQRNKADTAALFQRTTD